MAAQRIAILLQEDTTGAAEEDMICILRLIRAVEEGEHPTFVLVALHFPIEWLSLVEEGALPGEPRYLAVLGVD